MYWYQSVKCYSPTQKGFVDSLYSVVEYYSGLLDQVDVQVGDESVSLRRVHGDRTKPM